VTTKRDNIAVLCEQLQAVAEFLGVFLAASPAFMFGLLYTRQLEREMTMELGADRNVLKEM